MPVDVLSYLLGVASTIAALGLYRGVRRGRQRARDRQRARRRRGEAIARQARHDAYKARVRFVPSDQLDDR